MNTKRKSARNKGPTEAVKTSQSGPVQEAIQHPEAYFRLLTENSRDGIMILDGNGTIHYESPSVQHMLGYAPGERTGKNSLDFVISEDMAAAAKVLTKVIQNPDTVHQAEIRVRHSDNSNRTIEIVATNHLSDPVVRGIIANFRDVTERKRTVDELRRSEERLRLYLDKSPDGIFVSDLTSGKITYVNSAAERITGYSSEELTGKNYTELDLLSLDSLRQASRVRVLSAPEKIVLTPMEYELKRKNGSYVLVEVTVFIISEEDKSEAIGIARDVTERRRTEEALRQSEQNYKVLFESSIDGMLVIDVDTVKIVLANRRAEDIFAFDSGESLPGLNPVDLICPDDRKRFFKFITRDIFEKDNGKIYEFRVSTGNGKVLPVSVVGMRTEFEGRLAVLVSIRDITERKRMQEEKNRMEQQLQLAGRLAAVGELSAGIAHELNNPLATVQMYTQLLRDREDIDESVKSDIETIYNEAHRAAKITSNLLSFARKHWPEKRLFSFNELVERSLELHAYRMKVNNITIQKELDDDLPMTMADYHQMQQVFTNIITNAEQAMTEAHNMGTLLVKTQRVGDMIQINFIDDGPGISEENLRQIFDPFFTTKDVGRGTGLGLSICYGIVQAHGGRISVRSKKGSGTTFIVEIPIVIEEDPASEQPEMIGV